MHRKPISLILPRSLIVFVPAMYPSSVNHSQHCINKISHWNPYRPTATTPFPAFFFFFLAKILETVVYTYCHFFLTSQPTLILLMLSSLFKKKNKQTNLPKDYQGFLPFFSHHLKHPLNKIKHLVTPAFLKHFLQFSSKALQSPSFPYISPVISSQSSLLVSLHFNL